MDTLTIVRKIREAESLAAAGRHTDACSVLKGLLGQPGLSDTHRILILKKHDLFVKQQQRATRVMSRRAAPVGSSDASSEHTAIRPVDPDRSERPTDRTVDEPSRGIATEVVPKAPTSGGLKTVGRDSHSTGNTTGSTTGNTTVRDFVIPPPGSGQYPSVSDVRLPVASSDSQELAPVRNFDDVDDVDESDPRATDIFRAPPADNGADEESAPAIGRYARPGALSGALDTPVPGPRDTPVPSSATPAPPVRDSIVMPRGGFETPPPGPPRSDKPDPDSTWLMADDYFPRKASSDSRNSRSSMELKALAERLPDDDLRRELALEVVRLREAMEGAAGESDKTVMRQRQKSPRRAEERSDSGSFHIPASQVNTIVRRAAGTDSIEVHMPGRDDDAADLMVLRRDSVRGEQAEKPPTDRIALAQDYIDAAQIEKPSLFKPLATYMGFAVVVALIGWAVHLAYRAMAAPPPEMVVSERGVGPFELGKPVSDYPELTLSEGRHLHQSSGMIVHADADGVIRAISIPGPASRAPEAAERFRRFRLVYEGRELGEDWSVQAVLKALHSPDPPYSEAAFNSAERGMLVFLGQQATVRLEIEYRTSTPDRPERIRLMDAHADLAVLDVDVLSQ